MPTPAKSGKVRALVDQLFSSVSSSRDTARDGIAEIYSGTHDRRDRHELLGWLVAAGPAAREALDAIENTRDEIVDTCRRLIHLPARERVATLATLLAAASKSAPPQNRRLPAEEAAREALAATDPRRKEGEDASDPPPDEDLLLDSTASEANRLKAMKRLPPDEAAGLLERIIERPLSSEREFATAALTLLWREGGRTAVADVLSRLAAKPSMHRYSGKIERGLSGHDRDVVGAHHRGGSNAGIGDGWLTRAIAECSAPNILSASAGRELIVIPRILRRYAEITSAP